MAKEKIQLWNEYTQKFNRLAIIMYENNININLLTDLLKTVKKLKN